LGEHCAIDHELKRPAMVIKLPPVAEVSTPFLRKARELISG
jgi:hypothetical protein